MGKRQAEDLLKDYWYGPDWKQPNVAELAQHMTIACLKVQEDS